MCTGEVFADTEDPDYQQLLGTITAASQQLKQGKRFDMPGFRPNEHYIREMQRFGALSRDRSDGGAIDVYATDQTYWKSFWHLPPNE